MRGSGRPPRKQDVVGNCLDRDQIKTTLDVAPIRSFADLAETDDYLPGGRHGADFRRDARASSPRNS